MAAADRVVGPVPEPEAGPDVLGLEAVSVRFDDLVALDGVDLTVAEGEVVALLGPSGCGKTTLLRVIAGLQAPAAGHVRIDGTDVDGVAPHRRGVGLMFQAYALFPHRNVADNVGFGLEVRRQPKAVIRARVAEVLDLVGLTGYGPRSVAQLSGGEQQRVALARALAPSPRVLMLDEPFGALDRSLRDRLVVDLQRIVADLGVTVVHVTHDQTEALALADRLVVMDHGSVIQSGSPAEVWNRPANASVAGLLGLANVVDVEVRRGTADSRWGPLGRVDGLADGVGKVVIRPESVRLGPGAGAIGAQATVVGHIFRGERVAVRVALVGTDRTLEASVPPPEAPEPGSTVRVTIDHRGVIGLG